MPKFHTEPLETAIRRHVGHETLGSARLRCGLGVVTKRLDTGSTWLFHNNPRGIFFASSGPDAEGTPNSDLPLAKLIRASTAAPSYFEPELIDIARGITGAFVDGGVTPHLNPALLMLMLATLQGYGFRWPMGAERLMLVSVGSGSSEVPPATEAIVKMPAAWLAVSSLRSLMQDCDALVQTLLQWMGSSPTLWPIDSEIGDLANDRLGPHKLFHYLRYDVVLQRAWLHQVTGFHLDDTEIEALQTFDRPGLVARLLEIGRLAAEVRVHAEHLPPAFDVQAPTDATERNA